MMNLLSVKFSMDAEILQVSPVKSGDSYSPIEGEWETNQDPITGEIKNVYVPSSKQDNPLTPIDESQSIQTVKCLARSIVSNGIGAAGSTQKFGEEYRNIDFVQMWVPPSVIINKNNQVTNIRDRRSGRVMWMDEEYQDGTRPTVFNVNGVTPEFDPFNRHVQNYVLLEKAP